MPAVGQKGMSVTMKSILVCGVGGQGTLLASKLIAQAAMAKGWQARSAETIGMAQRGGSVVSHVRIGDEIFSPMIPLDGADVILGFEPGEAMRALPYLKQGGTVVVSPKAVQPVTASLGASKYLSLIHICLIPMQSPQRGNRLVKMLQGQKFLILMQFVPLRIRTVLQAASKFFGEIWRRKAVW